MSKEYHASIKDGREIYIPNWPVDVSLANLSQAGKCFGDETLIRMSSLNIPSAIVALMNAGDTNLAVSLIKHFICQVRIDGSKILPETINDMFEGSTGLAIVMELFCHVLHSQFSDFFELGLAKAHSQDKQ